MSQCARVLEVLADHRFHSIQEIHQRAGTMRLNSRIAELRKRGHDIQHIQQWNPRLRGFDHYYVLRRPLEGAAAISRTAAPSSGPAGNSRERNGASTPRFGLRATGTAGPLTSSGSEPQAGSPHLSPVSPADIPSAQTPRRAEPASEPAQLALVEVRKEPAWA